MASTKQYSIVINGLKESADAVDVLTKQLDSLEQRIDALNKKGISVGDAVGGKRTSELSQQEKIVDSINQSMEKRVALEGELGKQLQNEKQLMKELTAEQKSLAAKERLDAGGYNSNTMLGLKQELYDIKAAMQTMDMGSTEFSQMTQRALDITNALKKAEEAYGTFSRNVGNYSDSIMESFKQITVQVGDQEVKFKSLKDAYNQLKQAQGNVGYEKGKESEEYKNVTDALDKVTKAYEAAKDAANDLKASSQGMDNLMDWMQSFGAMGQMTQGFSAMFGGTGFEESIQKLMSLQSVLQGLEKLNQQMNTESGFGKMFKTMSQGADEAAVKLLRVKGGMEGIATASKTTQIAVKGLSVVIKGLAGFGIGLLIDGAMKLAEKVGNLVGGLFGWNKENENLVQSSDVAAAAIEYENKQFEMMQDQLKKDYLLGLISQEEYLAQKANLAADAMERQIKAYQDYLMLSEEIDDDARENLKGINGERDLGEAGGLIPTPPVIVKSREDLEEWFQTYKDIVDNGKSQTAEFYGVVGDLLEELPLVGTDGVEDAKKVMTKLGQTALGEFSNMYDHAMETMKTDTKAAEEEMKVLLDFMNGQMLTTVFLNLDQYVPTEALKLRLQKMKADINNFMSGISFTGDDLEKLKLDALPSKQRRRALIDKEYEADKKKFADNAEAMELVEKKHQNQLNELAGAGGAKRVSTAKKTAKQTLDVQKEKLRLEIELMDEGLKKTIAQLNKQRDEELKKVKGHKDLELKVNQLYDKKILEERKKFGKEMKKTYDEIMRNILEMTIKNLQSEVDYMDDALDKTLKKMYDRRDIREFQNPMTTVFGQMTKEQEAYTKKLRELLKEDMFLRKEIIKVQSNGIVPTDLEKIKNEGEKQLNELKDKYKDLFKTGDFDTLKKMVQLFDATFNESTEQFKLYLERTDNFWKIYLQTITKNIDAEYETRKALIEKNQEKEKEDNDKYTQEQIDALNDYYRKLRTDDKRSIIERANDTAKYTAELKTIIENGKKQDEAITKKYNVEIEELEDEHNKKINEQTKEANNQRMNDTIAALQKYSQIVQNNLSKAPVRNAWGFINIKESKKEYQDSLNGLETLRTEIIKAQSELRDLYNAGQISTDEYNDKLSDLENTMEGVNEKIKETKEAMSMKTFIQDFFQSVQIYYSALSAAVEQVWGELDNLMQYDLDRQQDALDKENEMLQKKLEEQEEILERHKERVDDIEDKLSEARGDRREALIDALNAEILAQRRAQAEKERLEKEQEKIEEKQKELDFQREMNQYYAGLRGILFNTAQAVMSAAANNWPLPAIPLMAAAGAAGAVQYALAAKQRPIKKAEGGLLEGASHANGGIPVGHTGIEVEGGEYVIRKSSTKDNVELLDYINSSKRKLYVSDLIDFFKNDKKSFIANTSKTRFADGGQISLGDYPSFSLGSAFESYANRPIWVSVQEIRDRTADVEYVEAISGLRQ